MAAYPEPTKKGGRMFGGTRRMYALRAVARFGTGPNTRTKKADQEPNKSSGPKHVNIFSWRIGEQIAQTLAGDSQ